MSSKDSSIPEDPQPVMEVIFKNEIESSEEPPMEEWSSLNFEVPEENVKRLQYDQGLYDPGSGEICTKYIPLSASSLLRHPYYNYPGIIDPGIEEALLQPEPKIKYPDDGQELYLALCKESNLSVMKVFHRQLLEEEINLSYYGVNSKAFRLIALSLKYNRFVTVLNLTDNWINHDGCFHLGEMLLDNITLKEINLYGCKIGPEGARRLFAHLHLNRSLKKLNLSRNELGDTGVGFIAKAIFFGTDVTELILSRNELTANSVLALNDAFETNNKLTHLDLSWNNILSPNSIYMLCQRLSESEVIRELNLSWNSLAGLRVGNGLKVLLKNRNIKCLNLSNNKLSTPVVKPLCVNLGKAIGLVTLNLSYNPFTAKDALTILDSLKNRKVKLQELLLDNVVVTEDFVEQRNIILSYPFRKKATITHGYVEKKFVPKGVDMRELILNRIDNVCKHAKKKSIDIALVVQELYKNNSAPMDTKYFTREMRNRGAQLDEDVLGGLFSLFAGPSTEKSKTVDLGSLIEYLKRLWPERKLPPTPPPELESEVPAKLPKKKKGGKKK